MKKRKDFFLKIYFSFTKKGRKAARASGKETRNEKNCNLFLLIDAPGLLQLM